MKTFEQYWQQAVVDPENEDVTKGFHRITWDTCTEAHKKELHDMAGKIQSAQLRAEVAERKLKEANERIDQNFKSHGENVERILGLTYQLSEAEGVVAFYADKGQWASQNGDDGPDQILSDYSFEDCCAGKRAREYQQKYLTKIIQPKEAE